MKRLGVIDARGNQYSLRERLHLLRCLSRWSANLYVFGQLSWERTLVPLREAERCEFSRIVGRCRELDLELWAWMKPGDRRYVHHRSDRQRFIDNALGYMDLGADGFYLKMDDLHPGNPSRHDDHIRSKDAECQALLIEDLDAALGDRFKAICGEHYNGTIPGSYEYYWDPIFAVLPKRVQITWTGPRVWNRALDVSDIPDVGWPLLLFENYFASDTDDPKRSPIYPYDGRSPALDAAFDTVLINPSNHYAWQFCALQTAMDFWHEPERYDPKESFKQAVRDLGDMYMEDYSHFEE